MSLCFVCNDKLQNECTRVCSSITPYSNKPYSEKIAEILGNEFVVIANINDQMCMKCTSILEHLDKSDNDAKLVKNVMVSFIQKKYGILPPNQVIKDIEIVNGHLMTEEELEQDQHEVYNDLTVGGSSTTTTNSVVAPITTPFILSKTPKQQQQQQQQKSTKKIKIYKCKFCPFHSKEIGHALFHMRTHKNKVKPKTPILNQAAAKTSTPVQIQKKLLYKCQICAETFDSRINCLDHIKKEHFQPSTSTSNGARETERYADVEREKKTENAGGEETENSQEDEAKSVKKPEPAREEISEVGGEDNKYTAVPEQEEADQETSDSVKKKIGEDNSNVENKTHVLDVESLLVPLYNNNPPTNSIVTQYNS